MQDLFRQKKIKKGKPLRPGKPICCYLPIAPYLACLQKNTKKEENVRPMKNLLPTSFSISSPPSLKKKRGKRLSSKKPPAHTFSILLPP